MRRGVRMVRDRESWIIIPVAVAAFAAIGLAALGLLHYLA